MKVYFKEFYIETDGKYDIKNITYEVEKIVEESGIKNGFCLVFLPHATASIILNEDEPNIRRDYRNTIKELFDSREYFHDMIDDNASAHVTSSFLRPSVVLPVINGRLIRGTWQEIMILEMDTRPRRRRVIVGVLGE